MSSAIIPDVSPTSPEISNFVRALQFGDSMLPVGAFSFSNGLESAIQTGIVHDVETLRQFVRTATEQSATCDGVALLEAHRAALEKDFERVKIADRAVYCRKMNEEVRTMTVRMGRKLAELAVRVVPDDPLVNEWLVGVKQGDLPGTYPIGQALVFAGMRLSEEHAFVAHQYGISSMMLGAALRLMKVNHLESQSILFEINQSAGADYQRIVNSTLHDMATFAPLMDILAGVHVKSRIRMFMN